MATLQKFKLFATQCGVAQSPTRSPRTSPVVHLRRRKTTLRMLLTRTSARRSPPPPPMIERKRETLKDLFVCASPDNEQGREIGEGKYEVYRMKVNGLGVGAPGSPRPGWLGFRHRVLLRKAYRPMLAGIPESEEME